MHQRTRRFVKVKNILIVDRDLGFVFWLGQILDAAGYVAVPAKGVAEAAEIVDMLHLPVDVLIASPVEHGVREFTGKLRFTSPDLHVVALGNEGDLAQMMPPSWAAWKYKPRRWDEAAKSEWLDLVRDLDCRLVGSACRG